MKVQKYIVLGFFLLITTMAISQSSYNELYRPQLHFSPAAHWMNDPNGMVYSNGTYHLFYQYYPDSTVWGPMHWAHATSKDLVHWQHQPIALYPDSLGLIFSGSAVLDKNNTSGFGKNGKAPLVAIYTSHDMKAEKEGKQDFERQSVAYSLDDGRTWTKYTGNPVIPNAGVRDFRDPKVSWYEKGKKWVMILAEKDHVSFYSSPNLKNWTKESEFGRHSGAHGGVWECPDLFPLSYNGKQVWVATVSINPGAPNGGSGTQYFVGNFDGKTFTAADTTTKWIDYGTDDYAGVTWGNTGNRRIFLGWMSNWNYATIVPTSTWRSANTLPRDLALKSVDGKLYLTSMPVKELDKIATPIVVEKNVSAKSYTLPVTKQSKTPYRITVSANVISDISFAFSNKEGEKLVVGFDKSSNEYFIDRSNAGQSDFRNDFAGKHTAPRLADAKSMNLTIVVDNASVEVFADNGLTVMTDIFFPKTILNSVHIESAENILLTSLKVDSFKSIWK